MRVFKPLLLLLSLSFLHAQAPVSLQVTEIHNITSLTQVIDNRSIQRKCNNSTFSVVSGTGSWSVQLEYADTANTGPWTSFGAGAIVTATAPLAHGAGYGFHNFFRLNTTVGTTVVTFSCEQDFALPSGGGGGSGANPGGNPGDFQVNVGGVSFGGLTPPIPVALGGTGLISPLVVCTSGIVCPGTWPDLAFSLTNPTPIYVGTPAQEVPGGAINGTNSTFTLVNSPNVGTLLLFRNGVRQQSGVDYTLSGSVITFLTGAIPQAGDTLVANYQYGLMATGYGTITGVVAGVGLSGGGVSGSVTLNAQYANYATNPDGVNCIYNVSPTFQYNGAIYVCGSGGTYAAYAGGESCTLSYQPGYTSDVPINLCTFLSDQIDVRTFGAIGVQGNCHASTVDNEPMIQAALNYAAANGPLDVLLPNDYCWPIGSHLWIPPGVHFHGIGRTSGYEISSTGSLLIANANWATNNTSFPYTQMVWETGDNFTSGTYLASNVTFATEVDHMEINCNDQTGCGNTLGIGRQEKSTFHDLILTGGVPLSGGYGYGFYEPGADCNNGTPPVSGCLIAKSGSPVASNPFSGQSGPDYNLEIFPSYNASSANFILWAGMGELNYKGLWNTTLNCNGSGATAGGYFWGGQSQIGPGVHMEGCGSSNQFQIGNIPAGSGCNGGTDDLFIDSDPEFVIQSCDAQNRLTFTNVSGGIVNNQSGAPVSNISDRNYFWDNNGGVVNAGPPGLVTGYTSATGSITLADPAKFSQVGYGGFRSYIGTANSGWNAGQSNETATANTRAYSCGNLYYSHANGNWPLGGDGGSDYSCILHLNGGGLAISSAITATTPLSTSTLLGNARLILSGTTGNILIGAGWLNVASGLPSGEGTQALQVKGDVFVSGAITSSSNVVCDGTTDATSAINTQLTKVATAGGGQVSLPVGTCIISGLITIPSEVSLAGQGRGVTTITVASGSFARNSSWAFPGYSGAYTAIAFATGATNAGIYKLSVNANGANNAVQADAAIGAVNITHSHISNVEVDNAWNGALGSAITVLGTADSNWITDDVVINQPSCAVDNDGPGGYDVGGYRNQIARNYVTNTCASGLSVGGQYNVVDANVATIGSGTMSQLNQMFISDSGSNNTFTDNICLGNGTGPACFTTSTDSPGIEANDNVFAHNTAANCGTGILVASTGSSLYTRRNVFDSNIIVGCGFGAFIGSYSQGTVIKGGSMYGSTEQGINIYSSATGSIQGVDVDGVRIDHSGASSYAFGYGIICNAAGAYPCSTNLKLINNTIVDDAATPVMVTAIEFNQTIASFQNVLITNNTLLNATSGNEISIPGLGLYSLKGGVFGPNVTDDGFNGVILENSYLAIAPSAMTLTGASSENIAPGIVGTLDLTYSSSFSIGGFTSGIAGRQLVLINTSSNSMTINNLDGGSSSANQILTGTGANVTAKGALLQYDGVLSKWVLIQ